MSTTMDIERICRTRRHCRACRASPVQRHRLGLPDVCPHGITAKTLPRAPVDWFAAAVNEAQRAAGGRVSDEVYDRRQTICGLCHEHDCPAMRMRACRHGRWLRTPQSSCPATPPRWRPVSVPKESST